MRIELNSTNSFRAQAFDKPGLSGYTTANLRIAAKENR